MCQNKTFIASHKTLNISEKTLSQTIVFRSILLFYFWLLLMFRSDQSLCKNAAL